MWTPSSPAVRKTARSVFRCLLVAMLIISAASAHASSYLSYTGLDHIFKSAPSDIPAPANPDTAYDTVLQKLAGLQGRLRNHQPATITLTEDEVNSLIAHNPALTQNNIRAYVSFQGDEGRLQTSVPTDILTRGALKGQFFNMDIAFTLSYDPTARSVNLTPRALQVGDQALIDRKATGSASGFDAALMTAMLNFGLRQNADVAAMLDQTQSVEVKDGVLVIRTR